MPSGGGGAGEAHRAQIRQGTEGGFTNVNENQEDIAPPLDPKAAKAGSAAAGKAGALKGTTSSGKPTAEPETQSSDLPKAVGTELRQFGTEEADPEIPPAGGGGTTGEGVTGDVERGISQVEQGVGRAAGEAEKGISTAEQATGKVFAGGRSLLGAVRGQATGGVGQFLPDNVQNKVTGFLDQGEGLLSRGEEGVKQGTTLARSGISQGQEQVGRLTGTARSGMEQFGALRSRVNGLRSELPTDGNNNLQNVGGSLRNFGKRVLNSRAGRHLPTQEFNRFSANRSGLDATEDFEGLNPFKGGVTSAAEDVGVAGGESAAAVGEGVAAAGVSEAAGIGAGIGEATELGALGAALL